MQFAILALTMLAMASASPVAPSEGQSFEVIPGEGLPSLESLGLTSADLNDPDFYEKFDISDPSKEADVTILAGNCNREFPWAPIAQARSCERYLAALSTQNCALRDVGGAWSAEFCRAGRTIIVGGNPRQYAASHCRDVAGGARWVLQNCNNNQRVRGSQAALGNGHLLVGVRGI